MFWAIVLLKDVSLVHQGNRQKTPGEDKGGEHWENAGAMLSCANLGRDRKSNLLLTELPLEWKFAGVAEKGWKLAGAAGKGD